MQEGFRIGTACCSKGMSWATHQSLNPPLESVAWSSEQGLAAIRHIHAFGPVFIFADLVEKFSAAPQREERR